MSKPKSQTVRPTMALRDYFAGCALTGMLSNPGFIGNLRRQQELYAAHAGVERTAAAEEHELVAGMARFAYMDADAMLAERDKEVSS